MLLRFAIVGCRDDCLCGPVSDQLLGLGPLCGVRRACPSMHASVSAWYRALVGHTQHMQSLDTIVLFIAYAALGVPAPTADFPASAIPLYIHILSSYPPIPITTPPQDQP